MNEPVFLVGSERSGTTLLRLMLDHHPQIAFHHEAAFLVEHLPPPGVGWPDMEGYRQRLRGDRIFEHSHFRIDETLDYVSLVNSFLEQKRQRDGKPILGATIHHAFDRLVDIWPNARFIHLIRDPRDVARSVVQMGWAGNVYVAAKVWVHAEQMWDQLRRRLEPMQFIDIHYRNLIEDYKTTLGRICEFIGVDYDPAMLSYADHTTYGLPDSKLVQQWRHKLTGTQIRLVESQVGELLERRGFERSGLPPLDVSRIRLASLLMHSRFQRAMYRLHRYGVSLYLQDQLSRRLRIGRWQAAIRPRLRKIDEQFIR